MNVTETNAFVRVGLQLKAKCMALRKFNVNNTLLEVKDDNMEQNIKFPVRSIFYASTIEMALE